MGCTYVRSDPTLLQITMQAQDILEHVGWAQYLSRLQGFNDDIALKLLQNLQNERTIVKGKTIAIIESILAVVVGLPTEVINWVKNHAVFHEVVELFKYPGEELVRKGKGICPTSLSEPWHELAKFIQKYITCDGCYDVV